MENPETIPSVSLLIAHKISWKLESLRKRTLSEWVRQFPQQRSDLLHDSSRRTRESRTEHALAFDSDAEQVQSAEPAWGE